jgi:hypothetical protein
MIYRFKVWFEEDEDINRVIDIQPTATFLDLHNIVLDSIGFNKKEPSSFYVSDDNWRKGKEVTLEDKSNHKLLMNKLKINELVDDPHQKFLYITDFKEQWTLHIELQSIQNDVKGIKYPLISKSNGKAPKQNEGIGRFKIVDESEFDEIANKLVSQQAATMDEGFDEEAFGEEGEDEETSEDEFGESLGEGEEEHI